MSRDMCQTKRQAPLRVAQAPEILFEEFESKNGKPETTLLTRHT